MLMPSVPFSVRIDDALKKRIDHLCDLTDRSQGFVASKALEEYLERYQWKIEALKRAKEEADKGEFISHDSMLSWVESIGTDEEKTAPTPDIFTKPL